MKSALSFREECEAKKIRAAEQSKREKERQERLDRERRDRIAEREKRERENRNMERRDRSFRDDRSRPSHRQPASITSSNDPKLLYSRVFIGNLATDKVESDEVEAMFSKYGKILAVTMFKGFAFVQYERESDARQAVSGENGNLVKGRILDVKMAAEGKKSQPAGGRPGGPGRGSPSPRDDPYMRDRSPVRDPMREAALRDPYLRDDPYARAELDAAYRRLPPPRDPRDARDPYMDRYEAYRLAALDPYADPLRELPPPFPERPPFDCEIIITNKSVSGYAELLERQLKEREILCDINGIPDEQAIPRAVEECSRRQIPFAIVVNPQNEAHRSVTVNILHGVPQEHRNMPFEDALVLVARNYDTYIQELREKAAAGRSGRGGEAPEFIPPDQPTHYLLNLLADNRILTLEELDSVTQYLGKRRLVLVGTQGGAQRRGLEAENPQAAGSAQQQLQSKMMGSLNGSGQAGMGQNPSAAYGRQQMQQSASSSTSINFDNPSVQKALDNLIQSGPNLLRNINAAATQAQQQSPQGYGGQSQLRGAMGDVGRMAMGGGYGNAASGGAGAQRQSAGLAGLQQYGRFN